jgi:multiple sugar transport system substrate-binding protein
MGFRAAARGSEEWPEKPAFCALPVVALSKLIDQPFWLDASDPHRMVTAMQFLTHPRTYNYGVASGNWRHVVVEREAVWSNAIQRVAAEGISPEQAVDEAIARISQILNE